MIEADIVVVEVVLHASSGDALVEFEYYAFVEFFEASFALHEMMEPDTHLPTLDLDVSSEQLWWDWERACQQHSLNDEIDEEAEAKTA